MKLIYWFQLLIRSYSYKRSDVGGIGYVISILKKGQCVLDVGCHKGEYLFFMRKKVGPTGKVYAFEPQSALYKYLLKVKILFKWDNVVVEQIAVSNTKGLATLFVPGATFDATLQQSVLKSNFIFSEQVPTETLDSYCEARKIAPEFVKIDVEGNELNVLNGGVEVLKKYKPRILIEIEARHVGEEKAKETFEFLMQLGYEGSFVHNNTYKPLDAFSFKEHQNKKNLWSNKCQTPYCNNFIFEVI